MAGVFYCSGHESVIIRDASRSLFRTRVGHYSGHVSIIIRDTRRSLCRTRVGHYSGRMSVIIQHAVGHYAGLMSVVYVSRGRIRVWVLGRMVVSRPSPPMSYRYSPARRILTFPSILRLRNCRTALFALYIPNIPRLTRYVRDLRRGRRNRRDVRPGRPWVGCRESCCGVHRPRR